MTFAPDGKASPPDGGFDAASLERSYAFLDECPERLLDDVIASPIGSLRERVRGVRVWRNALLEGRLPPRDTWPPAEIADPARQALEQLGIARFCKGQPELVDDLLEDLLAAYSRRNDDLLADIARRLRELEEIERKREEKILRERKELEPRLKLLKEQWGAETRSARGERRRKPIGPDEKALQRLRAQAERKVLARPRDADPTLIRTWEERVHLKALQRLRAQAEREVLARPRDADPTLIRTWEEHVRLWAAIAEIFDDLGEMLGRGWDLTLGVLHRTGWRDVLRLRELVEQLPQLRDIVRSLGRLHDSETAESVAERVFTPMRRLEEERLEIRTPLVPADTRGVERSGSVARMLPVEAAMLGHPKLKLLWHARWAERALLTYRVEGADVERTLIEREAAEETEARRPARERGPILAVVDTSGSMRGLPEQVAKALILEALRSAHAEKRRCRLYSFSGPGQVVEHELDLSPEGMAGLLEFLGLSFGGGSDPAEAAARVLRQIREHEWSKADVLFVSDGEWPAPSGLVSDVRQAREAGIRFHGIQIGNRGRTGLHEICEPVHVFTDWLDMVDGG